MHTNTLILTSVNRYLTTNHPFLLDFWQRGKCGKFPSTELLSHADYVYIMWLLGEDANFDSHASETFLDIIAKQALFGKNVGAQQSKSPHMTAYLLGASNILANCGFDRRDVIYNEFTLDLDYMLQLDTHLPRWPPKWSHHIWRVSHWIGGIPAILLNLARFDPKRQVTEADVHNVLEACDRYLISDAGLLRTYQSELLQTAFRLFYRLRHDPRHADIGGIAHLHWVNYALGRPSKGGRRLLDWTTHLLEDKIPFIEKSPYCLDFDFVQLQRTLLTEHPSYNNSRILERADRFSTGIQDFLDTLPDRYALHRLPGALAALHEVSLMRALDVVPSIGISPRDVIKTAFWL
jgi:hypothetical protein